MPISAFALRQRMDELHSQWDVCMQDRHLDCLVELAVSVSSLTELFISRGLLGLHQTASALEKQVLTLLELLDETDPEPEDWQDVEHKLFDLDERVKQHIRERQPPIADRRSETHELVLSPKRKVSIVSRDSEAWNELVILVGNFGISTEIQREPSAIAQSPEPQLILMDVAGFEIEEFCRHVRELRNRFTSSQLVILNAYCEFHQMSQLKAAGADHLLFQPANTADILERVYGLFGADEEEPYRVLILESSHRNSIAIARSLAEVGVVAHAVTKPEDVLIGLQMFKSDLVLMNMVMHGCNGVQVTGIIRQHPDFQSTPIVYLSKDTNVSLQVEAMRLGGDHFLARPCNPVLLNTVVRCSIERYRALQKARQMDNLTGLFNHTVGQQRLEAMIRAQTSDAASFCIALVDIDRLNQINGVYGRAKGDQVVRGLGWMLRQRLRKTDLVARSGSDKFLLVLPGTNEDQAGSLLGQIRSDFARNPTPLEDGAFACTFSGGVAAWRSGLSSDALLQKADEALKKAKSAGRNQILVASPG